MIKITSVGTHSNTINILNLLVLTKRQHWQITRNGQSTTEWAEERRYEVLCEPAKI